MPSEFTTETSPFDDVDYSRRVADAEVEAVLESAAKAARRFWITRRRFRAAVVAVDAHVETYQRALHSFERRTLSLQTSPGGDKRNPQPLPDPDVVDPWAVDPRTVHADTRVSATCPACDGSKRVTCSTCDGTTRARCSNCGGTGKTLSQRKGQLLKNCPRCRGSGALKCTHCRGGFVECSRCAATGVITAWLALERKMLAHVHVHPRNAATAIHHSVDDASDFDAGSFANALIADSGHQTQLPPTPAELHPAVNGRTDRLQSSRLQTFSAKVHRVCFASALASGQVEVAGRPFSVASTSDWDGLRLRRATILSTLIVGLSFAAVARYAYGSRHQWFERFGDGSLVLLFGCGVAVAVGWLSAALSHARRARAMGSVAAAAILCTTSAVGLAGAFVHAKPSAEVARAALKKSALDDARLEAQALIDLGLDRASGESVLDEIQDSVMARGTTCHQMAAAANYDWHSEIRRSQAAQRLRFCAARESAADFSRGDATALEQLGLDVGKLAPTESSGARWLAAVLRSCSSIANDDLTTANKELAEVTSLAGDVPDAMRPSNFAAIVEAAGPLRESVAATTGGNARARRKALTVAIDEAKAFAALTPMSSNNVAAGLESSLQRIRRQIARADRKRSEESEGTEEPSVPPASNAGEQSGAATGGVLNPY